ncbi:MAG: hypothetical protein NUV51_01360, partial [Sulfuricaulis sp.]|nr:hypothetical protein [Sulfuricaulis sp.]
PAVVLTVSGALTIETNFAAWGVELRNFIDRIPEKPATDQEFADCKAAIVAFKAAEAQLDAEEKRVLSMVTDIDAMQREKKLLRELSSTTRLALEKMVVRRDLEVKTEIMQAGKDALTTHIAGLNKRFAKVQMPPIAADFAAAIKSKRNLESMRDAVSSLVAAKKIESNEIADRIDINLKALHDGARPDGADYTFLFSDYAQLILKAPDDLALVIKSRIQDHKDAEAKRLAAEREKIRAEEEAKATAEAKIKADQIARKQAEANEMAMQEIMGINQQVVIAQTGRLGVRAGGTIECIRETLAETESWMIDDRFGALIGSAQAAKDRAIASIRELLAKAEQEEAERQRRAAEEAAAKIERDRATTASPAICTRNAFAPDHPLNTGITEPAPHPDSQALRPSPASPCQVAGVGAAPDNGRYIRLGEINAMLGFTVTSEFLAGLGFVATQDKNAKLYRECDFPLICRAIVEHIAMVASVPTAMRRAAA